MMRAPTAIILLLLLASCDRSPESDGSATASGRGGMPMTHRMGGDVDTTGLRSLPVPVEHVRGREIYDAMCASCHGEAGLGSMQGPPLVHIIYEPNHHADAAFILAAEQGVRAHHWRFGDMPAQPAVSRQEVMEVVGYIRWLQREAGVY